MASIDINADYKKLQTEVESTKTYKDLKKQYDKSSKFVGDLLGPKLDSVSKSINDFICFSFSFGFRVFNILRYFITI